MQTHDLRSFNVNKQTDILHDLSFTSHQWRSSLHELLLNTSLSYSRPCMLWCRITGKYIHKIHVHMHLQPSECGTSSWNTQRIPIRKSGIKSAIIFSGNSILVWLIKPHLCASTYTHACLHICFYILYTFFLIDSSTFVIKYDI